MSQTIDQKVVEMRFDNTQFEKAIDETQRTLKNFKSDLDFEKDGSKFSKLGDAADTVKLKFSALETVAVTALVNITNKAIAAGERLVKSLSVDNISAGWQKYADKTSAVQTIMSATSDLFDDEAEHMEYVNEQIDRLNWFTDETSYSLIDMTSNIGKFVAAGVDLPKAVDAMQGIATWAGLSGANTEQASRAMYNLAQAMGTGAVKVQDWMSIENANMATKEFKEIAIDTAKNLGDYVKDAQATLMVDNDGITFAPNTKKGTNVDVKNFRSTLAEGWFTSDVLNAVLERYGKFATRLNELSNSLAEDEEETASELISSIERYGEALKKSDVAKQEEILGEYAEKTGQSIEELRKQFNELAEDDLGLRAFKASQEAKTFSEAIQSVKDAVSTGWMNTFEKIFGTYDKAKELWTDVANGLWDVFASGGRERNKMLNEWVKMGGQEHIHDSIVGLISLVNELKEVWNKAMEAVFGKQTRAEKAAKLFSFTEKISNAIKNLALFTRDDYGEATDELSEKGLKVIAVFKTILNIVKTVGKVASTVFKVVFKIVRKVWGVFKTLFEGIVEFFKGFKKFFDIKRFFGTETSRVLERYGKQVQKPLSLFDKVAAKLKEWASKFDKAKFLQTMQNWGFKVAIFLTKAWKFIKKIPERINGLFTKLFGIGIPEAIHKLWDSIKAFFSWLSNSGIFPKIWDGIKNFFSWIWNGLKSLLKVDNFGQLVDKIKGVFSKIFGFIGGLFTKKKKSSGESGMMVFFGEDSYLAGPLREMEDNASATEQSMEKSESTLSSIFKAMGNMIKALFTAIGGFFGAVDWNKIFTLIGSVVSGTFSAVIELIRKIDFKTILVSFGGIVGFMRALAQMKMASAICNMAKAVKWMSGAVSDLAAAKKINAIGYFIRGIALLAIAIAAAIFVLGRLMTPEQLMRGSIVLGAFLVAIFALVLIMLKATNESDAGKAKALSESNTKTMKLMISVTAFILAISRLVSVLVKAITSLTKIDDAEKLRNATIVVSILMVLCIGLAIAVLAFMKKLEDKTTKNKDKKTYSNKHNRAAETMLALAGFLLIFSFALKVLVNSVIKLTSVQDPKALWRATGVIAILAALVIGFAITVLAMTKNIENNTTATTTHKSKVGEIMLAMALFMVAISFAIRSLVVSIAALTVLNQNNLASATAIVFGLITVLMLFSIAILVLVSDFEQSTKKNKTTDMTHNTKAASAMLAVAVVLVAMAAAIRTLANALVLIAAGTKFLGAGAMWQAFAMIAILLAGVTTIAVVLAKVADSMISPKNMIVIAAFMAVLAIVIRSLVKSVAAVGLLEKTIGTGKTWAAFGMVAILLAEIAIIAGVLAGLSKVANPVNLLAISASMIAIAIALRVLMPAFVQLSEMKFGKMLKAAGGILLIMAAFAAGGILMSAAVPGLLAFSALLLALGVSLFLIAEAIKITAPSIKELADGIVYFSKQIEKHKVVIVAAARTLANAVAEAFEALLTGALRAIAAFLNALVGMSGQIFDALVAIGTVFLNSIAALIAPAIEVVTTLIIEVLKGLIEITPTLGDFLYEFLHMLINVVIDLIPDICELVVEFITKLLEKLAEHSYRIGTALMDFLVGLIKAVADKVESLIDVLVLLWKNMFNALTKNVHNIVGPAMEFLSAFIGELALGIDESLLEPIGKAITGVIETILGAPLAGIMGSVGMGLSEFAFQAKDFFDAIKKVDPAALTALGSLGEFILAITANAVVDGIGKLLGAKTSSLEKFGKELKGFAKPLIEFSDEIKGKVDSKNVEAVGIACQAIAALYPLLPSEGGLLQDLLGEVKDLGSFGAELGTFGPEFKIFYDSIKDLKVDPEVVKVVSSAAETMAGLYALMPLTGGILQKIIGEVKDLGTFGKELGSFGTEFGIFYGKIKNLNVKTEVVDTITTCASAMAGLYPLMPLTGGVLQKIIGEVKDLGSFGQDMSKFAEGFTAFSDKISSDTYKFNKQRLLGASSIAAAFANVVKNLSESEYTGFLKLMKATPADKSIAQLGEGMKKFGACFIEFSNAVSADTYKYDEGKVNAVSNIATAMADVYKTIGGTDGWFNTFMKWAVEKLTGDAFTKFGNSLTNFGNTLVNFVKTLSADTVSDAKIQRALSFLDIIKEFLSQIEDVYDNYHLTDTFASDLNTFNASLAEILFTYSAPLQDNQLYKGGQDLVLEFFNGIKDTLALGTKYFTGDYNPNTTIGKMITGLFGDSTSVPSGLFGDSTSVLSGFMDSFYKYFDSGVGSTSTMSAAAKLVITFMNRVKLLFGNNATELLIATTPGPNTLGGRVNAFMDALATHMDMYASGDAYQLLIQHTGYWVAKGLADGINSYADLVNQAGQNLYAAADLGTRNRGMIQSPSKAMYQNGVYVVQGLVNGINENLHPAELSGESLADTTLDGFQKAMLAANDYVTDSMGGPLTLTPVLDLSEIQNGTNQLSQMMSSVDGYLLDGSARFASAAYMSRPTNEEAFSGASVDRLTNAIEDLIKNPSNSGNFENTFNITGTDAREIAEEVSRILQLQVERRQAVWG